MASVVFFGAECLFKIAYPSIFTSQKKNERRKDSKKERMRILKKCSEWNKSPFDCRFSGVPFKRMRHGAAVNGVTSTAPSLFRAKYVVSKECSYNFYFL